MVDRRRQEAGRKGAATAWKNRRERAAKQAEQFDALRKAAEDALVYIETDPTLDDDGIAAAAALRRALGKEQ